MTDPQVPVHSLNIYGQSAWHGDAFIVGSREALGDLASAIAVALGAGQSQHTFMVGADGEGYFVKVIVQPEQDMGLLVTPYTDEMAADNRDAVMPWDLHKVNP